MRPVAAAVAAPEPSSEVRLERAAMVYARLALGSAFLSAVAGRFGIWDRTLDWAHFERFMHRTAEVNAFMPAFTIPFLAWAATAAEISCGVALIIGVHLRWVALAVLTDYEQIPRFMPDVRTSVVRERAVGWAVVEQEAVSSVMMFTKRVHLVLEIEEQRDALIFRDRCGRNFVRYEGAWRISEQDGQTAITYELTAEPSFDVPGFMVKRIFRRDAAQMIEHLQREIAARAARGAGVAHRVRDRSNLPNR